MDGCSGHIVEQELVGHNSTFHLMGLLLGEIVGNASHLLVFGSKS
jgi:hypothetical protein